jgi:hypothetical protein
MFDYWLSRFFKTVFYLNPAAFISFNSAGISSQSNLWPPVLSHPVCFELPSSYSNLISWAEMISNMVFLQLLVQFFATIRDFTFFSYFNWRPNEAINYTIHNLDVINYVA